jgi:hypothetical protein
MLRQTRAEAIKKKGVYNTGIKWFQGMAHLCYSSRCCCDDRRSIKGG